MFLTSPDIDLQLILIALAFAVVISLIIGLAKRNLFIGLLWFSVLGNIIFIMNMGSDAFGFYNIEWLLSFSILIWPILNIILIMFYLKNKKIKK